MDFRKIMALMLMMVSGFYPAMGKGMIKIDTSRNSFEGLDTIQAKVTFSDFGADTIVEAWLHVEGLDGNIVAAARMLPSVDDPRLWAGILELPGNGVDCHNDITRLDPMLSIEGDTIYAWDKPVILKVDGEEVPYPENYAVFCSIPFDDITRLRLKAVNRKQRSGPYYLLVDTKLSHRIDNRFYLVASGFTRAGRRYDNALPIRIHLIDFDYK